MIHADHPRTPFPANQGQKEGTLTERQRGSQLDAKTAPQGVAIASEFTMITDALRETLAREFGGKIVSMATYRAEQARQGTWAIRSDDGKVLYVLGPPALVKRLWWEGICEDLHLPAEEGKACCSRRVLVTPCSRTCRAWAACQTTGSTSRRSASRSRATASGA